MVVLTLLLLTAPVRAEESLTRFQARTQVLVWDTGERDGVVDAKDSFTDLTQPCLMNLELALKTIATRNVGDPARIASDASLISDRLGLISPLHTSVISTFLVDERAPTVLLFPEMHLKTDADPKVMPLHQSRAFDMLAMAEDLLRGGHTVLNELEGPFGRPWAKEFGDFGADRATRLAFARKLSENKWMSGAVLIGEALPKQIPTRQIDDNALTVRNLIYTLEVNLKRNGVLPFEWAAIKNWIQQNFAERLTMVDVETFKPEARRAWSWPEDRLNAEGSKICEERSVRMAQNTLDYLVSLHADVAFVSVGALHAHGVMQRLREARVNYVVFSPNF